MIARLWRSARYQTYGVLLIGFVVALVAASIASYEHVFTPSVMVTVRADRTGLLLDPGSDVTLRGVDVGKVRSVHAVDVDGVQGAVIDVALEPNKTKLIPRDATADIEAPTVFGAKFVDLADPQPLTASTPTIQAGDVIMPTTVAVEVNDVFQNLIDVLDAVDPSKVDVILGSFATALKGNGERTGQTIVATNELTTDLDQHVDALQTDLLRSAPVIKGYSKVTPALIQVLQNIGMFSGTLVDTQQSFTSALTNVTALTGPGTTFFAAIGSALPTAVATLKPAAQVLDTYSPTLPCVINGTVQLGQVLQPILGGNEPGLHVFASFLPGAAGYDPTKDLPIIDSVDGPDCLGGPVKQTFVDGKKLATLTNGTTVSPYPHIKFRDGTTTAFAGTTDCLSLPNANGSCLTPTADPADTSSLPTVLNNLLGAGVIGP